MNVIIIEDERMAANRLAKMLTELNGEINVVEIFEGVEDSVQFFSKNQSPDAIFMDIQLSDGISFEIFDMVDITCPVIFTTAYDEYALNAFKVNALDYLLKPIKREDLAKAVDRLHQKNETSQPLALNHPDKSTKVLIKMGHKLIVLKLNDAAYYYSQDKITFHINEPKKRYPVDYSLDKLESELSDQQFFRVNRQFIVNRDSIKTMLSYSANRIKLELEPEPPKEVLVSKDRVSSFRKWLVS